MKTAAATAIAAASLLIAVAFAAPAVGGGVATHYTVHCADAAGTTVMARSYGARMSSARVARPTRSSCSSSRTRAATAGSAGRIATGRAPRIRAADRVAGLAGPPVTPSIPPAREVPRELRGHSVPFGASRRLADERRLRHEEARISRRPSGHWSWQPLRRRWPGPTGPTRTTRFIAPTQVATRRSTSRSTPRRSSRAASSARSPTSTPITRAGPAGPRARSAASRPSHRADPPSAAGPPAHAVRGKDVAGLQPRRRVTDDPYGCPARQQVPEGGARCPGVARC